MKAMPSTAAAMREAESGVPALGMLTLVSGTVWLVSAGLNLWLGTPVASLAGYCALFTAAVSVIVLSARSVLAYAILSFNAVIHETLRVRPIPVAVAAPHPIHSGFYASLAEDVEAEPAAAA